MGNGRQAYRNRIKEKGRKAVAARERREKRYAKMSPYQRSLWSQKWERHFKKKRRK